MTAAQTARSASGDLRVEDLGVAVLAYGRSNAHADLLQSLRAEAVLCSTGWRMGTALNAAASVSGIKHRRDAFH